MSSNKIIKSVSFNLTNEEDVNMLNAIKKRHNFSGYVKKLILADLASKNAAEGKCEAVATHEGYTFVGEQKGGVDTPIQEIVKNRIDEIKKAALERAAKDKGN